MNAPLAHFEYSIFYCRAKPTKEMQAALKVINDSLQKSNQVSTNLRNANKIVQMEWFRISSTESAQPLDVEDYLDYFEEYSTNLLKYVVNLSDANVSNHNLLSYLSCVLYCILVFAFSGQYSNALCYFPWKFRCCFNFIGFESLLCKPN